MVTTFNSYDVGLCDTIFIVYTLDKEVCVDFVYSVPVIIGNIVATFFGFLLFDVAL